MPDDLEAQGDALDRLNAVFSSDATAAPQGAMDAFCHLLAQALQTPNSTDHETVQRSGEILRRVLVLRLADLRGDQYAA